MSILEQADAEAPGLRERKKQQTRVALHDAAVELVGRQGLDGTTIEQICDAAGVSHRTFFNYFASKSAAVLGLPDAVVTDAAAERFRASERGLVGALSELMADEFAGGVDRLRIKALLVDNPELRQPFQQWMGGLRERIVGLVEERTGDRDDAEILTALVMAAIGVLVHERAESDIPISDRVEHVVRRFVELASA